MLSVLEKVFKDKVATPEWQAKLHQIVPSYGTKLNSDPARVQQEWNYTAEVLQLATPPVAPAPRTPRPPPAPRAPKRPPTTWRCRSLPGPLRERRRFAMTRRPHPDPAWGFFSSAACPG